MLAPADRPCLTNRVERRTDALDEVDDDLVKPDPGSGLVCGGCQNGRYERSTLGSSSEYRTAWLSRFVRQPPAGWEAM